MFLRRLKRRPPLLGRALKELSEAVYDITKHKLLYTVNITKHASFFEDFLRDNFKNNEDLFVIKKESSLTDKDPTETFVSIWDEYYWSHGISTYDFNIVEGIPCAVHLMDKTNTGNGADTSNDHVINISTLRYGDYPERLREMLKKAYHIRKEKEEHENAREWPLRMVTFNNGPSAKKAPVRRRTFNDVYVPADIKNQITTSLDNFIAKKEWYKDNVIPYHFGIMLYGPPGTGKTSIAQAIANYIPKSRLIYLTGDMLSDLPTFIENDRFLSYGKTPSVFLVEDIDCGFGVDAIRSRRNKYENVDENEKNNGLGIILNSLDGLMAPTNAIFIFTTNHIDQLDPALIRPGRIDLMLEIKPICMETFKEFMVHHYGEDVKIPKTLKLKDDVTFAKLQIMVMSGSSATDIINYVKEKDNAK